MKYCYGLLMLGLILSCGTENQTETASNNTTTVDTETGGIIEYDLNEDRLSAVDYNNELSLVQQRIFNQINVLFMSDPLSAGQNLGNITFEIDLKMEDLKRLIAPEGGESFKKAILDLFGFYKSELSGPFLTILPLLEKDPENRTKEEEYKLIDYDEQFAIAEEKLFTAVSIEQDKFAKDNNFKITDL